MGKDKRVLEFQDVAAALLHSYGNALYGCPCSCRDQGFSLNSLMTKGLRGYFVQSRVHGSPRFLHHREAALLLGLPNNTKFVHDPRGNLALLGLIASPLQMIWVYGHLLKSVQIATDQPSIPAPDQWLHAYQQELIRQSQHLFQQDQPGLLPHVTLTDPHGVELVIASATSHTISQLLQAQRIVLDWNEAGGVTLDGLRLPLHRLIDCTLGPYALTSDPGLLERDRPSGLVMIGLQHAGHFEAHLIEAGSFIFELLRKLRIHNVNFLVDDQGKIYGADFRLWKTVKLTTLDHQLWPPRSPPRLHGDGTESTTLGLHDGHIWLALSSMVQSLLPHQQPLLIPPRDSHALLNGSWNESNLDFLSQYEGTSGSICSVFVADGHWALLWGELNALEITWFYCDGLPGRVIDQAGLLAGKLNQLLHIEEWEVATRHLIPQETEHTCGSIAILHVGLCLGLFGVPTATMVSQLHSWLLATSVTGHLQATGLSPDQMTRLEQMLRDHGVPQSATSERAKQVIQKLGPQAVQEAFNAKNSWAYLKAMANKPSISLRLVHADELSKHIDSTAKEKFGAAIPNAKQKKKTDRKSSATPIAIDPSMLRIQGFKDSEDDEVPQIEFSAVEAEAHGVAVCSLAQGLQLLKTASSISSNPLALVVTETPPEQVMQEYEITPLTFTATYTGTGEPMIIFGAMKNLGDIAVRRVIPASAAKAEVIDTQVIKAIIYRDELEYDWHQFAATPVKVLSQAVPLLQLCRGVQCGQDCGKSHSPVDETYDSIMMEIWSRTFGKLEGGKASSDDAQVFWVYMRVPLGVVDNLLQTNVNGIYFEPRSETKGNDESYRVIWLPSRTHEEALCACKTSLHALGLVRLKRKYGVRVKAGHEEAAFKALRPDATFVDTQVQRTFQLFPLPHGLQKGGLQKLLAGLKWTAKPLQPGKSTSAAMSWHVGSSTGPPVEAFTAFDQEVIVTELTREAKPKPPPRFLASMRTEKHMRSEAASSSAPQSSGDPWLVADPWKDWKGSTPSTKVAGKQHLQEVTGKIKDELAASLDQKLNNFKQAADSSESDAKLAEVSKATEHRFKRMECTMDEMKAQQHQFTQWFGSMGQQIQASEQSIQTIQYTLNTHQQELTGLRSEIQAVPEQVNRTMQQALATHSTEVSSDFDKRFARLEALLEKKQRTTE